MESRLPLDGFKQRQPWRVLPAASKNGSLIYPTQWWPVPTARVRTLFHVGTVGGRESIRCTRSGTRPPRSRSGSRAWRPLGSRRRSRAAASRPRGSAESRRFAFARAPACLTTRRGRGLDTTWFRAGGRCSRATGPETEARVLSYHSPNDNS
jgi:hypothetical protein